MADKSPLFDGADVTGIGWGAQAAATGVDTAALRRFAPDAALLQQAADEIVALRAEVLALKKGLATQARRLAARAADTP